MDAAQAALCPLAPMETAGYAQGAADVAWSDGRTGAGIGLERPWPVVECRASHINDAFRAAFFANPGLPSLQMEHLRRNRAS